MEVDEAYAEALSITESTQRTNQQALANGNLLKDVFIVFDCFVLGSCCFCRCAVFALLVHAVLLHPAS